MDDLNEKALYAEARRKDAGWYFLAIILAIAWFTLTPPFSPLFSLSSLIMLVWSVGIMKRGKLETEFLLEAEPIVERLKADGMTEHEAMLKCGIDRFYCSPFWAVR